MLQVLARGIAFLHMWSASCPRPNRSARSKVNSRLSIPNSIVKTDCSRRTRCRQSQWQYDHCKAKDAKRNAQKKGHDSIWLRWQDVEKYRNSKFPWDGRRNIVDTRIQLRLLTSHTSRHGASVQDMTIILRLESMMRQNQDRRNIDLISHEQFARLQPYNRKRERRTRFFPNTNENDNVQSNTESDMNVNGKVGVGTSTTIGHSLPLLQQLGGSHKNGKSHKNDKNGKDSKNGENGENGKNKYSISESSFHKMNHLKSERIISHFRETFAHS